MAAFLGLVAIVACTAALLCIFSAERIVSKKPVQRLGRRLMRAEPPSFSIGGTASVRPAFPANF